MTKFSFLGSPNSDGYNNRVSLVTVSTFFDSEDIVGYMKKSTFKNMMVEMKEVALPLFRNYNEFFNAVRDGLTINNAIDKKTHRISGADYYHVRFRSGKQRFGCTIYEEENISQFIKDYANGLIRSNFTLSELIEEANK